VISVYVALGTDTSSSVAVILKKPVESVSQRKTSEWGKKKKIMKKVMANKPHMYAPPPPPKRSFCGQSL
jgi:hypothetical protein